MLKRVFIIMMVLVMVVFALPNKNIIASKKIKLNKKSATIYVGNTVKLKVKNSKKRVKWTSSNKRIASVNKSGKVTGKKTGKVRITAKVAKKKLKCTINVIRKPRPWDGVRVVAPSSFGDMYDRKNRMTLVSYSFGNDLGDYFNFYYTIKLVKYGVRSEESWANYIKFKDAYGSVIGQGFINVEDIALGLTFFDYAQVPTGTKTIEFLEYPEK